MLSDVYSTASFCFATSTINESILPRCRRAWASWNYHISRDPETRPTVTYNMSMLQHIDSPETFCVTLNEEGNIAPDKVLATFRYDHPLFTTTRTSAQKRHEELIRHRRTSYCGAYWRNGFHEDGVVSALAVCRRFGFEGWSTSTSPTTSESRLQEGLA